MLELTSPKTVIKNGLSIVITPVFINGTYSGHNCETYFCGRTVRKYYSRGVLTLEQIVNTFYEDLFQKTGYFD